jgi:beta-glucosidase
MHLFDASDSYINGEAAYETIKGVQSAGVQACAKHLIGYHQVWKKILRELGC